MQFIVVFQPREQAVKAAAPAEVAQVEQAEQVQARALYKRGDIRQIWALQREGKGAVGLFEAASREDLDALVASFPMVQKRYAAHEVFPLGPFEPFAE